MRVAIVYIPQGPEDPEKLDLTEQVTAMARFLSEAGHSATPCGVRESPSAYRVPSTREARLRLQFVSGGSRQKQAGHGHYGNL